jgi:PAS domain-containing protein
MEQLQRYLDAQAQPLVLLEDGVVAWVNRAFRDLVARGDEDLLGEPLPAAGGFDPEESRREVCEVALVHATGYLLDVVVQLTRVGPGSWMLALSPANYEQTQLRDRISRLEALVDGLPVGVLVSEGGLRLGYVNEALAVLLGASPVELLGLGWLERVPEAAATELRELALTALTGVPVRTTLRVGEGAIDVALTPVRARDQSLSFVGTMVEAGAVPVPLGAGGLDVDEVTGVGNARRLREELGALLAEGDLWLAGIELRDLEEVARALGEAARDRLLAWVAKRLRGLRVWRSGLRSFVVMGAGPGPRLVEEVRTALDVPFACGAAVISVPCEVHAVSAMRGEDVDIALIRLEQAGR